jgi:hypothetical protein
LALLVKAVITILVVVAAVVVQSPSTAVVHFIASDVVAAKPGADEDLAVGLDGDAQGLIVGYVGGNQNAG